MNSMRLMMVSLVALGLAAGCSSAREIEVTGEVSSAQTPNGPISLEFFEQAKDDESAERVSVHQIELDEPGAFAETIEVAEDLVIAYALVDEDGDGQCSDGELWAEAQQEVAEDDTLEPLTLALAAEPCPEQPEEE